jgi:UDP-2-acetamido-2-deoxy-ribo-hexuluronate aminotransferase
MNVPTAIHYPLPLNKQHAFVDHSTQFQVAEKAAAEVLSLPFGPYISISEQNHVVISLKQALIVSKCSNEFN